MIGSRQPWRFMRRTLIKPDSVEQYKTERRFLARANTIIKELRVLNAIINRAVTLGKLSRNPIASVKAPRVLDSKPHLFYESEDLAKLYGKATPTHAPIWKFLANTGLRRGEALALRWAWISECSMRVLSTEAERTKSGKWHEVPLSDGAREALDAIKSACPEACPNDRVLRQMAPPSLSREFARDAKAAGIGGSLHTLRHTYISHLVRAGVPLRTVQIYAGHAHYTTTEGYAYLAPGAAPAQALRLAI